MAFSACVYVRMCEREIDSVCERELQADVRSMCTCVCACVHVREKCLLCEAAAFFEEGRHDALDLV